MTIGEQLRLIADGLKDWVREIQGTVTIAEDVTHLVSALTTAPGAPRVLVMFEGEEKRGDYEETAMADRTFFIVISRGRSLRIEDGAAILEGSAGGKPFYDLLEEGREVARALRFNADTTEQIPDYKRTSRVRIEGLVLDARQIEFSIGTQLPRATEEES